MYQLKLFSIKSIKEPSLLLILSLKEQVLLLVLVIKEPDYSIIREVFPKDNIKLVNYLFLNGHFEDLDQYQFQAILHYLDRML